jgi:hypothetical protein
MLFIGHSRIIMLTIHNVGVCIDAIQHKVSRSMARTFLVAIAHKRVSYESEEGRKKGRKGEERHIDRDERVASEESR